MNKKNVLAEATRTLKALFSKTVALTFNQFEDEEGNTYQYSVLEVGAEVFKATAEGSEPAPNGEYKVDANTSIVVEDGLISEVKQLEEVVNAEGDLEEVVVAETEFAEDEMVEEVVAEENGEQSLEDFIKAIVDAQTAMSDRLSALEEQMKKLDGSVEELEKEVEEDAVELEALKEGFSKMTKATLGSKLTKSDIDKQFNPNALDNLKAVQSAFSKVK